MTDEIAAPFDVYAIPGGMLCRICGLRYYSHSWGGPGVCPSCDCGNFGPAIVQRQAKEIERLQAANAVLAAELNRLNVTMCAENSAVEPSGDTK